MSYLSVDETSKLLKISISTLARFRQSGDGPTYIKLGRRVLYAESDVSQWLAARRFRSTAQQSVEDRR